MRSCGTCTLCCKVLTVLSLEKPGGAWCKHCSPAAGCAIYDRRPSDCRNFQCGFLMNEKMEEHWRPSTSHMIIVASEAHRRYEFHVDAQRPDAWRREPYHSELRALARSAAGQQKIVIVFIRNRTWVVYPDRDEDLGFAEPGDYCEAHFASDGSYRVVKVSGRGGTDRTVMSA
jgi:hypothetical protein